MSSLATALSPEDFEELRVISNVPYFSRDTFEESREIFADLLNANAAVQASNNAPVYDMEDGYTRDLFDLCDRVLVSAEVKIYSAILMNRYIHAVRQKADEAYPHGDSEEDMFGDIKLRMISVIHIASKMHMIHFSPRISEIVTVVELLGMDYTRAELIESELSV
uniref:Cyclin N-terminal domain-containing protein n=1 Tax=Steinernema glaseri TaxID=37863 RepID=A0A1I7Y2S7_9BILA